MLSTRNLFQKVKKYFPSYNSQLRKKRVRGPNSSDIANAKHVSVGFI